MKRISKSYVHDNNLCVICAKFDAKSHNVCHVALPINDDNAIKNFPKKHIIFCGYDNLWQADVIEMRPYTRFN